MAIRLTHVLLTLLATWVVSGNGLLGAELAIDDLMLSPGEVGQVVVSGRVEAELTPAVTVLVQIAPRDGAVGTVVFTPSPPVDIVQLGDPWPEVGTFDTFDTDSTLSDTLNGSGDDNGTFVPEETTFDGALVGLPVIASSDAQGEWDVLLTIPDDASRWETLPTTLHSGVIRVESPPDVPSASTWSLIVLALLLAVAGTIVIARPLPTWKTA